MCLSPVFGIGFVAGYGSVGGETPGNEPTVGKGVGPDAGGGSPLGAATPSVTLSGTNVVVTESPALDMTYV